MAIINFSEAQTCPQIDMPTHRWWAKEALCRRVQVNSHAAEQ
jgi:hypothetical protein